MTRNKKSLPILITLMVLLAACSGTADQAATETAEIETATSVTLGMRQTSEARSSEETQAAEDAIAEAATEAILHTQTANEAATSTAAADKTSTQEALKASGTQQSIDLLANIKSVLQNVGYSAESGHLAWTQSSPVVINLASGSASRYEAIGGGESYRNFIIHYNATWDAQGNAGCGLIFRSEGNLEDGRQNIFQTLRISGRPRMFNGVADFGKLQEVSNIVSNFSKPINLENGGTNNYVLVSDGTYLTVYVNSGRLSNIFLYTRPGLVAYLGWGETTCTFEDSWIWELP